MRGEAFLAKGHSQKVWWRRERRELFAQTDEKGGLIKSHHHQKVQDL
jgi:hypothetical protein